MKHLAAINRVQVSIQVSREFTPTYIEDGGQSNVPINQKVRSIIETLFNGCEHYFVVDALISDADLVTE